MQSSEHALLSQQSILRIRRGLRLAQFSRQQRLLIGLLVRLRRRDIRDVISSPSSGLLRLLHGSQLLLLKARLLLQTSLLGRLLRDYHLLLSRGLLLHQLRLSHLLDLLLLLREICGVGVRLSLGRCGRCLDAGRHGRCW